MLLDHVLQLADDLGVDTEIPAACLPHVGYLYSRAGFILERCEEELEIRPRGNLTQRFWEARQCAEELVA